MCDISKEDWQACCWKQLDMTIGDFHKVADDYKVSTRLPSP